MPSPHTQPIAHIGYHKTGTTWFQNYFYPYVNSHHYIHRNLVRRSLLFDHAFSFNPAHARENLGSPQIDPFIICEEELSGSFETGGHLGAFSKEVADRLYKISPQSSIVIFVRNQIDILASIYAQYIKMGGTHKPEKFFFPRENRKSIRNKPFKVPLFSFDHFNYIGLIRHYQELFPYKNVHVFLYEDFQSNPEKFLQKFSHDLGIKYDINNINLTPVNISFRLRALKLARLLNHFSHRGVVDKRYFISLPPKPLKNIPKKLNSTPFAGPRIDPEELLGQKSFNFIREYYKETNHELSDALKIDLKKYGYP